MNKKLDSQKQGQKGPPQSLTPETFRPRTGRFEKYQVQQYPPDDDRKRLIRIKEVTRLTNLSKSYIYQLCGQGLFPQSIKLVPGGTSVAWVEGEVLDWIESRIKERDQEASA